MPHPEAGRIPKAPHTFTDSKSTYALSVIGQKPSQTVIEILFIDSKTTYPPFVLAAASARATVESGLGFRHAPRLSTCTPGFLCFCSISPTRRREFLDKSFNFSKSFQNLAYA